MRSSKSALAIEWVWSEPGIHKIVSLKRRRRIRGEEDRQRGRKREWGRRSEEEGGASLRTLLYTIPYIQPSVQLLGKKTSQSNNLNNRLTSSKSTRTQAEQVMTGNTSTWLSLQALQIKPNLEHLAKILAGGEKQNKTLKSKPKQPYNSHVLERSSITGFSFLPTPKSGKTLALQEVPPIQMLV